MNSGLEWKFFTEENMAWSDKKNGHTAIFRIVIPLERVLKGETGGLHDKDSPRYHLPREALVIDLELSVLDNRH